MSISSTRVAGANLRFDLMQYIDQREPVLYNPIADIVLPPIDVSRREASIPLMDAGIGKNLIDNRRGENGSYKRGVWTLDSETYRTFVYGNELTIDNMEDTLADEILGMEKTNTEINRDLLLVNRDYRTASLVMNAANYPGANDNHTAGAAWNVSTADTTADIRGAANKIRTKKGVAQRELSLVLAWDLVMDLKKNTDIKEGVKYTGGQPVDRMTESAFLVYLAQYWSIKQVIAGESVYNANGWNVEGEFNTIWPASYALLAYLNPGTRTWGPGLGRQPSYRKNTAGRDYVIESYDDMPVDQRIIRAKECRGNTLFNRYGCLITGV